MKKFILLFFLIFSIVSFSQNLDSIYKVAAKMKDDSLKSDMYNKVAFRYIFRNPDKAIKIINEGKKISEAANLKLNLTQLINTKGIYMDVTGKPDSAKLYFEKALKMSRDYSFKNIESNCINNLGMVNWNTGDYQKALGFFFQSLKMNESNGKIQESAPALNNIGLIYQEMGLNDKALEYHYRALKIREDYNLLYEQTMSLNNIGINLKELNDLDGAEKIYKKALAIAGSFDNKVEYFKLLDNLANVYNLQQKLDLALKTYLKSLDRPKDYKADEKGTLSAFVNIATLFNQLEEPNKALGYIEKGFALLQKYPELESQSEEFYLTIAETNYMLGDYKTARNFKERFVKLKDSIFSDKNAKAMADMDVKYETEKKEREILKQRAEIAEQDLLIQRRDYQIYGALVLALILGLIGYLFYNQQKLKNIQLQKEAELKDALLKIETQNKLQEQRLRISRDLHDNIGAQLTFIISSIDNLKYGFELPNNLEVKLTSISSFTNDTIYELRDTIWAMNKEVITFEDLQIRMSNFINKANLSSQNIQFKFHVDDQLNKNKTFTSIEGMNVYRIIQESINNALKYANANEIIVNAREELGRLKISVKDNGSGFDIQNTERGNGLNNMKKRADEIKAQLEIKSSEGKGTDIQLAV